MIQSIFKPVAGKYGIDALLKKQQDVRIVQADALKKPVLPPPTSVLAKPGGSIL